MCNMNTSYIPFDLTAIITPLTDEDFDDDLWGDDPDIDLMARECRDFELICDLTGNIDSNADTGGRKAP